MGCAKRKFAEIPTVSLSISTHNHQVKLGCQNGKVLTTKCKTSFDGFVCKYCI